MKRLFLTVAALLVTTSHSFAGSQTDAALLLLEPSSARAAAVGEAFSAVSNDVAVFHYNPASLATLETGQASFLYRKGLAEDTVGHLLLGIPGAASSWGLSLAYYNGGSTEVFDGQVTRQVIAERDYSLGLGFAQKTGRYSLGFKAQYFSSELAETQSAQSLMADFGVAAQVTTRFSVGGAIQHMGSSLRYGNSAETLPQIARIGFSALLLPNVYKPTFLMDIPYNLGRKTTEPSFGLETTVGPLAFRGGYRVGRELEEFTFGTGFLWGAASLDYAFGLVSQLDSTHQISLSYRFTGPAASVKELASKQPEPVTEKPAPTVIKKQQPDVNRQIIVMPPPPRLYEIQPLEGATPKAGVYVVRDGDTLQSIAKLKYGFEGAWKQIYTANQHLIVDPENLKPGQKLLLPKSAQ